MRWPTIFFVIVFAFSVIANADSARLIKVLPHFLDLKGRAGVSPSLFDRDAYQQELRNTATNRSGLRFDVEWKGRGYQALTLRIEAKGGHGSEPTKITLEQPVKPGFFSRWTSVPVLGTNYQALGELVSWRATLLDGTNVVAEQKSFLW